MIVAAPPRSTKKQVIEIIEQIAFKEGFKSAKWTWLHDVFAATDDEDIRVDPAPKEKPPKKILIRSAKRGGNEIYNDDDDDKE